MAHGDRERFEVREYGRFITGGFGDGGGADRRGQFTRMGVAHHGLLGETSALFAVKCNTHITRRGEMMATQMKRLFPIRAVGPGLCLVGRDRFTAVLEAVPVNFGLRSERDQERLIQGYTAFLNGLSFPVELLVRSDLLRIDEYLGQLKQREDEMEAHLRPSLADYIEFIHETVAVNHLIRRRFYIVLSWQGVDSRSRPQRRGEVLWDEAEMELSRRRAVMGQGLRPLGIRLRSLERDELFRFLYAGLGGGDPLPPGVNWAWD